MNMQTDRHRAGLRKPLSIFGAIAAAANLANQKTMMYCCSALTHVPLNRWKCRWRFNLNVLLCEGFAAS